MLNNGVLRWVEDTSQSTMKIKFMYVIKGKTSALSYVEVADIKKYFDDFVILNISDYS
jgi:hypothetical protein